MNMYIIIVHIGIEWPENPTAYTSNTGMIPLCIYVYTTHAVDILPKIPFYRSPKVPFWHRSMPSIGLLDAAKIGKNVLGTVLVLNIIGWALK